MTIQTNKHDWFTCVMSSKNYIFVSDDDIVQKLFGIDTGCEFSIRYIGNRKIGFQIVIIVKSESGDICALNKYPDEVQFISKLSKIIFNQKIPIITCKSNLSQSIDAVSFGIFNIDTKQIHPISAEKLADIFKKINPLYTEDVGAKKSVNKTLNDDFQLFTREKLSKFMVVNDIDALMFGGVMVFVELKRIDTGITAIADWTPYLDDLSNYAALYSIAHRLGGAKVRTIAYPKEKSDLVAIHEIDRIDDVIKRGDQTIRSAQITGRRIICAVAHSLHPSLEERYISEKRREKPIC